MAATAASSGEGEGASNDSGAGDDLTPPVDWTAIWGSSSNNNSHDGDGGANSGTNNTAGVAGGDDDDNGDYTISNLMRLAHTRHYENLWWIQSQQKQHQKENLDDEHEDDNDNETAPTTITSDTLDPLEGVVTDISSTMVDFYDKQEQTQLLEPFVVPSGMNISFGEQQEEEEGGGGGPELDDAEMRELAFCHLEVLIPFTRGNRTTATSYSFDGAVGIALAIEHLNRGDGSLISEVENIKERCNIRFTQQFWDTNADEIHTFGMVDQIIRKSNEDNLKAEYESTCPSTAAANGVNHDGTIFRGRGRIRQPCTFVGAYHSYVSETSSLLTSERGFPQISGVSNSRELNDKTKYRYFGRSVPSDYALAKYALTWMASIQQIDYLAVVFMNNAYGRSFATSIRQVAPEVAPNMTKTYFSIDPDGGGIQEAIKQLKQSEYLFVFCALSGREEHDTLMMEAVKQDVAGNGKHNWMFANSFRDNLSENRKFDRGSPLARAYEGTTMIKFSGGEKGNWRYDKFVAMMDAVRNSTNDVEYLVSTFPISQEEKEYILSNDLPGADKISYDTAVFNYEATMLVGLAACDEAGTSLQVNGSSLFQKITRTEFESMSGDVVLDHTTGSRIYNTTIQQIINYVSDESIVDNEDGKTSVTFHPVVTYQRFGNASWKILEDHIFNDGSNEPPLSIPPPQETTNYLGPGMRAYAYALFGIVAITSVGLASWTIINRKKRIVAASQPFFLCLLCFGSLVLGASLLTVPVDHGPTQIGQCRVDDLDPCGMACTATIWLVSLGLSIMFSALLAKTMRVNRIMNNSKKLRRITVTVWDMLKPVLVVLSCIIVILVAMTVQAPIGYEIIPLHTDRFGRVKESYGQCVFKESKAYLISLAVIVFSIMMLALFQAWRARNLSTEFAETKTIFRGLFVSTMAAALAIPVLILARNNQNSWTFLVSSVIVIICLNSLLSVFLPKLLFERRQKKAKEKRPQIELGTGDVKVTGIEDISDKNKKAMESFDIKGDTNANNGTSDKGSDRSRQSESSRFGEKILTIKTKRELIEEVETLRRLLQARQKQELHLGTENSMLRTILREHGWTDSDEKTLSRATGDSSALLTTTTNGLEVDRSYIHPIPSGTHPSENGNLRRQESTEKKKDSSDPATSIAADEPDGVDHREGGGVDKE